MGREPIAVEFVDAEPAAVGADVVAVPVFEPPAGEGLYGDRAERLAADGELRGRIGDVVVLHDTSGAGPPRIAFAGIGKRDAADGEAIRTAAARVAARAAGLGNGTVAWPLGAGVSLDPAGEARAIVEGTILGAYDPGAWKSNGDRRKAIQRLVVCGAAAHDAERTGSRAAIVAEWANRCRDLVNAPANELTPTALAERAAALAAEVPNLRVTSLGRPEIEAAGMGAFLSVARGSDTEPRLIVLEYEPPETPEGAVLGLVGKAITFDTGGISLKPAARMEEMKGDMAGGAAVICGLAAIASLGLPVRALAVVPACENMPGGRATRPGDIVTAQNGTTIEITNTDAEGRLVLADALVEVRRRGATHVLDLATLTGGVVVALGDYFAGLMGTDDAWVAEVQAAAEASGDHAWRLPVHDTYRRYIRSTFADVRNSSGQRYAQSPYAARFLQEFAGEGPWAHLDIAGTAYLERGRGDVYAQKGATGYGVRLIAALAERFGRGG
jgi:leucyl aminopeptidase